MSPLFLVVLDILDQVKNLQVPTVNRLFYYCHWISSTGLHIIHTEIRVRSRHLGTGHRIIQVQN